VATIHEQIIKSLLPTKDKRDMVKVILDFGSAIPLKALHTSQANFFGLKSAECLPLWARYFDIQLGKVANSMLLFHFRRSDARWILGESGIRFSADFPRNEACWQSLFDTAPSKRKLYRR